MDAKTYIDMGNSDPYDAPLKWRYSRGPYANPFPDPSWTEIAARGIMARLQCVGGVKQELDCVEQDEREKIVQDIVDIINRTLSIDSDPE